MGAVPMPFEKYVQDEKALTEEEIPGSKSRDEVVVPAEEKAEKAGEEAK